MCVIIMHMCLDATVQGEETITLRTHPPLLLHLHNKPEYKLDISLDSHMLHRNINIGRIDREWLSSLRLLEISERQVQWEQLLPRRNMPHTAVQQLADTIRPLLSTLPDAEDGATNEYGQLVKIDTGAILNEGGGFNCSGFSKWVVDGLVFPIRNSYLAIPALKQRQLQQRGHSISARYEAERDPYFGLDWSRALAATYYQAQYDTDSHTALHAVDVSSVPYFPYIDDIGYAVRDLQAVLYLLTIKEAGNFYIGSLNKDFGDAPRLRQHFHIALFFPYFTETGAFKVIVFERNRETDLATFIARNQDIDIHLVRANSRTAFAPPVITQ